MTKPRGRAKQLIEAMQAEGGDTPWSAGQCAKVMGIERKGVSANLAAAVRNGWLHKIAEGREMQYALQPTQAEPKPFTFSIHSDGDIDLFGLPELENGGRRMTKDQVAELRKFIAGMPA